MPLLCRARATQLPTIPPGFHLERDHYGRVGERVVDFQLRGLNGLTIRATDIQLNRVQHTQRVLGLSSVAVEVNPARPCGLP